MNQECLCDCESETQLPEELKISEENLPCNRIFLNFTRDHRSPTKDESNIAKVKDLFRCLTDRQDLQEMKVSGWLEDEKAVEDREESEEDLLELCYDEKSTQRGKGQRFAMSRDFWYRKLNTLKAQKLDETALEIKDLPPDPRKKNDFMCGKLIRNHKILSSEIPEKQEQVLAEINEFERTVAKPVEKELKKRFINVYDNQKRLKGACK